MSFYVAYVGEVIIKPELRKDFGQFFRGKFYMPENEPLKGFAREIISTSSIGGLLRMSEWSHHNALKVWEGKYETAYDKNSGVFTYGVCDYEIPRDFFMLLVWIGEVLNEESFNHNETHIMPDSVPNHEHYSTYAYAGYAGKVWIKPEYREDFEHFFYGEYRLLESKPFKSFMNKQPEQAHFTDLRYWEHGDEKEEWRGKYKTSYNEDDGRFVYGITFNKNYPGDLNYDFINYILPELTESVISEDFWDEGMDEDTNDETPSNVQV